MLAPSQIKQLIFHINAHIISNPEYYLYNLPGYSKENRGGTKIDGIEYYITDRSHKGIPAMQLVWQDAKGKDKMEFICYQTPQIWGDWFNGPHKIPQALVDIVK